MSKKKTHIYLLPVYANASHLEEQRHATSHESKIKYPGDGLNLELSEENSLIEEKYCLSIISTKYLVEGAWSKNVTKKAGIHNHPDGHPWKHLQFMLMGEHEVIRIKLDKLDSNDYINCIKGFLSISQDIIKHEQDEHKIKQDLKSYFFNEKIDELSSERDYLLSKVKEACAGEDILSDDGKSIDAQQLEKLKKESHLLPFLDW